MTLYFEGNDYYILWADDKKYHNPRGGGGELYTVKTEKYSYNFYKKKKFFKLKPEINSKKVKKKAFFTNQRHTITMEVSINIYM